MASTSGVGPSSGGGSGKRPGTAGSENVTKKTREYIRGKTKKQYSVEEKKKIIQIIEDGANTCEFVKLLNVSESSVRNIRKEMNEIKAAIKTTTEYFMGGAGGARRAMQDTTKKINTSRGN
ncbi:hypothetical protein Pmani_018583 [Petrolisthes manimaculis]|uniref:HTH psq-type domain-containing protein n=1 Tax=Petrolisthes manimaculis TaxID=1843537 RepID=A0AAE1PMG8_9EUCA|nr:hypothetical protein Pmani_018583 [Petrolisthes manimaculis]